MSLELALNDWLPKGIHVALADPTKRYPLIGKESDAVSTAIEKRVNEFSAGRDAARRALQVLGHETAEIPVGSRRAPVWPMGVVGSITHSKHLCLTIVADKTAFKAVGIDAEPDIPLKDNLRKAILHKSEHSASAAEAIALFSMKEALFKTLFPITQEWMGFHDAAQLSKGVLQLTRDVGNFKAGRVFEVPTLQLESHVISFCCIKDGV